MEVKIDNIREAIKVFEDALNEAVIELPQQDRVAVERLNTLDQYKLAHPRGVLGILYGGTTYENTSKGRTLLMKRLMLINVAPIIRFVDNTTKPSDNIMTMMPAEYVDFVIIKLTGLTVFNHLPEYERKIYPIRDELIDEQDYVWKYLITFAVPLDLIEKID